MSVFHYCSKVVSKSARQKPGDVAERFGQQQEEGDQEMVNGAHFSLDFATSN